MLPSSLLVRTLGLLFEVKDRNPPRIQAVCGEPQFELGEPGRECPRASRISFTNSATLAWRLALESISTSMRLR
jgi:hypothetical protein